MKAEDNEVLGEILGGLFEALPSCFGSPDLLLCRSRKE